MPIQFACGFIGTILCMWALLLMLGVASDVLDEGRFRRSRWRFEMKCIEALAPLGILLSLTGIDQLRTEDLFLCGCAALILGVLTTVMASFAKERRNG